jgi:hypothetical protein
MATVSDIPAYLKWDDAVVGRITDDGGVEFCAPCYNETVELYTRGAVRWSAEELDRFLEERLVDRSRRDIEQVLFRCGLSDYDVRALAAITHGICARDLLWLAPGEGASMQDAVGAAFDTVFHRRVDAGGDSLSTPEGFNVKRYGVSQGRYGIFKKRLSPLHTDAESEVAVYLLAKAMGVDCCPAWRVDEDTVFSAFEYDFAREYLVHFRHLVAGQRSANEYHNILAARPQYADRFASMLLLDFVTRQDDRHLSNFAVKVTGGGEEFYQLYDNGRSLFYEDTPELVTRAASDVELYCTTFGPEGTYLDHLREIAAARGGLGGLANTALDAVQVHDILLEAGFSGYRLEGARTWIGNCLQIINELS